MTWSEGDVWQLVLDLPAGEHEFKVAAVALAGEVEKVVEWEAGPNRLLQVRGGGPHLQQAVWPRTARSVRRVRSAASCKVQPQPGPCCGPTTTTTRVVVWHNPCHTKGVTTHGSAWYAPGAWLGHTWRAEQAENHPCFTLCASAASARARHCRLLPLRADSVP